MLPGSTDGAEEGGVDRSRRRYLGATAAAVTAGLAGCNDILGGGSGSGSGPEAAVRDFVSALDSTDGEAARNLIHPDSDLSGQFSDQNMEQFYGGVDVSVESTEVVEQDGDTAVVSAEVTTQTDESEQTTEGELELRMHEDEWKIYSLPQ